MKKIIAMDFGGHYSQLIARHVRKMGVYCEVLPNFTKLETLTGEDVMGIVMTGVAANEIAGLHVKPMCDNQVFALNLPILGIGYGAQVLANGYGINGLTFSDDAKKAYGLERFDESEESLIILDNFIHNICGCTNDWNMADFEADQIRQIKNMVGDRKVVSGLSGGVDSAVSSLLVHRAIGDNLTCIFVNHGLLRKNEPEEVQKVYREGFGMNLIYVDASKRFLDRLAGVDDPEQKRKIIGEEFIRVFEEEASKLDAADFLVQGTIYPDVIESGGAEGAPIIKSHHNVGGLPEETKFKQLIEPLRSLFKDEVRELGMQMGIPENQVWRQPFPGPGLGVRVIGDITEEKLKIVRESDFILREEIAAAGLQRDIWQYFTIFTPLKTVGAKADMRTYDHVIAIRAITTVDVMTADFARIPYDVLAKISNRIVYEVEGVNRVVYDVTSKPPGTVEWE